MISKRFANGIPRVDHLVACDGRCDKAWGVNGRPSLTQSEEDGCNYLGDDELGTAPPPGKTATIAHNGRAKPSAVPLADGAQMNDWCIHECERSWWGGALAQPVLPDMTGSAPNVPASPL